MKIELADFPVRDARFGRQTGYSNGVLEIDKEELRQLILQDRRVVSAQLELALPDEKTRIVNIRDAVEPRVKVSGPGCVFPGIMGPVETVGSGRTHRLSGITVMPSAEYHPTILSGLAQQSTGLLDMWGPGSTTSPFGSTINLVLVFRLAEGVSELEAHSSIQMAEFKVAHRLAETTREKSPESVEVFELTKVDPALPRVVYILGCPTVSHAPHSLVAFYGVPIRDSLPTFMHPNELIDGAITVDPRKGARSWSTTWGWMNHPVVFQLLRQHGKRLSFIGVILQKTGFTSELEKQVTALQSSQIATLLGADGAIVTTITQGGSAFVETVQTVQACERKGVKTVLITAEAGGVDGQELPLLHYVSEATAIVSTGSYDRVRQLPVPTKVIGVEEGQSWIPSSTDRPLSPWGELTLDTFHIFGGSDWWGGLANTCKAF